MISSSFKILKNVQGQMKKITVREILTDEQIYKAVELGKAKDICSQIIKPNIEEINNKIGQQCDALYLSYMVEYALSSTKQTMQGEMKK